MTIQYMSDLHLESLKNYEKIMDSGFHVTGDILVLAGDIIPHVHFIKQYPFFQRLNKMYKEVFWIPGNYEYYGKEFTLDMDLKISDNMRIVNNCTLERGGINFIFSTLWSNVLPVDQAILPIITADYKEILGFDVKYQNVV